MFILWYLQLQPDKKNYSALEQRNPVPVVYSVVCLEEYSSGTKRFDIMRTTNQGDILTVHVSVSVSCPLEYTATRGRIQSPGYPGYRNNFECQIIVHGQNPHQVIYVKVEHFDLEESRDFLFIAPSQQWTGSLESGHNYTGVIILHNCGHTVYTILLSSNPI